MPSSFRIYIDESGDLGFKFRRKVGDQNSSDWFILAAYVTRTSLDVERVKIVDAIRQDFKLVPKTPIHWNTLRHEKKIHCAKSVCQPGCRAIAVCIHKPSILEPEKFQDRSRLYWFGVKFLLERVSWLARDNHNPAKYGGDGSCEMFFSNRGGMRYDDLKDYLQKLDDHKSAGKRVEIDFGIVKLDQIHSFSAGRLMGLQLADIVAGATFNALERDRFGNTEPRYFRELQAIIYTHKGALRGYGLKIIPREAPLTLSSEKSFEWVLELP